MVLSYVCVHGNHSTGHIALLTATNADSNGIGDSGRTCKVLQSHAEGNRLQSTQPGVNERYTLAESHDGYYYEFAVFPKDWLGSASVPSPAFNPTQPPAAAAAADIAAAAEGGAGGADGSDSGGGATTTHEAVVGNGAEVFVLSESVVSHAKEVAAEVIAKGATGTKGAGKFKVPAALRGDGAELKRQLNQVTRNGVMPVGM